MPIVDIRVLAQMTKQIPQDHLCEFNKAIFVEFTQKRDYYGKKGRIRYF